MKLIQGDLIKLAKEGHFDVIVHGCNCFCTMGNGIARTIKDQFPQAYAADLETKKGDRTKLGTFSRATAEDDFGNTFEIFNAYTQYNYGGGNDLFEYDAFLHFLNNVAQHERLLQAMKMPALRYGFPLIGCGLAGGDKIRILAMIEEVLADVDVTVVEFQP